MTRAAEWGAADGAGTGRRTAKRRALTVLSELPLVAAYVALTATLSVGLGQDVNWDLFNYHFYNPHALLTGRLDQDVLPAGIQSFFNPVLDIPFYLAIHRWDLPPVLVGAALGGVHGLNLWLVHTIVVLLLPGERPRLAFVAALVAALTSAMGAAYYGEIASTMHDNTVSVLVLAAAAVLLRQIRPEGDPSYRVLAAAGVLAGLAAGAKLVTSVFVIGLAAFCLAVKGPIRSRLARTGVFVLTAGTGAVAAGGLWAWLLWTHFGSPLYPFYNRLFRSPFAPLENFADERFLPRNAVQAVFYPLYFATEQNLAAELLFRDARIAAAFVTVIVVALTVAGRVRRSAADVQLRRFGALSIFCAVSYLAWLPVFSIYRYLVPVEVLSPALVVSGSMLLARRPRFGLAAAAAMCLVLIITTKPLDFGRVGWTASYFRIDAKALEGYRGATILMRDSPNAYVVPFFPASATFLRIDDAFLLRGDSLLWPRIEEAVRQADPGSHYLLEAAERSVGGDGLPGLDRLGLTVDRSRCRLIPAVRETARICPVARRP